MAATLCFKSCETHSLAKGYNGGVYGKTVSGVVPKEEIRPVLLDSLAPMYVTCTVF